MDNLNCLFFKYQIESLVDMKVGHTIDEVEREFLAKPYDADHIEMLTEDIAKNICKNRANDAKRLNVEDRRQFNNRFPTSWAAAKPTYKDISWQEMRSQSVDKWGYASGHLIHAMISWIYIRPDVSSELNLDDVGGIKGLIERGTFNVHYFVVRSTAINYYKMNSVICERTPEKYYYSPSSDGTGSQSTDIIPSRCNLIDDEAEEDGKKPVMKKRKTDN